jgi:Family of unknown function (DUF6058)
MAVSTPDAQLPASATEDIAYVRAAFVPMDDAVRPLVERGLLPRATYVLPDGTPMVPADHAELLKEAGGDPDAIAACFAERIVAAGAPTDEVDDEYRAWLSGEYGACLYDTSPESIRAKGGLMDTISALLVRPAPESSRWRTTLRFAVDALDALERPFAAYDRERFGGPVSRDRLVTATRERFAELWS